MRHFNGLFTCFCRCFTCVLVIAITSCSSFERRIISKNWQVTISNSSVRDIRGSSVNNSSPQVDETMDNEPSIYNELSNVISMFLDKKEKAGDYDSFIFFTDPHNFSPNNSFDLDREWFLDNFELLKKASSDSYTYSVVCGGDVLNNFDTKEQAIFKLRYFVDMLNFYFSDAHFVVGNHDTNYQGDSYMLFGDYSSCSLSQEEINDALFFGKKSYYFFDSQNTRHYCFDSGVDWGTEYLSDYQKEQLLWFANDLFDDSKYHKTIIIHIALNDYDGNVTSFMDGIGKVIQSYNGKNKISLDNQSFDYSKTNGRIDFIQCGHLHKDFSNFYCGGVPIIATRTFSSPEIATKPTFDIVLSDYSERKVFLFRVGDGSDRIVSI